MDSSSMVFCICYKPSVFLVTASKSSRKLKFIDMSSHESSSISACYQGCEFPFYKLCIFSFFNSSRNSGRSNLNNILSESQQTACQAVVLLVTTRQKGLCRCFAGRMNREDSRSSHYYFRINEMGSTSEKVSLFACRPNPCHYAE